MFQYAAGRALALRLEARFSLDVSTFKVGHDHNGFELPKALSVVADIAPLSAVREILGWRHHPLVRRALVRWSGLRLGDSAFVAEPHFHYWPGYEKLHDDVYLQGYWQSEAYFKHAEAEIRREYRFRYPLSGLNGCIARDILQTNSVCIHVRRGDYVSKDANLRKHGLCTVEYYRRAMILMNDLVEGAKFFIFSDDVDWVRENLNINRPHVYVEHNRGIDSYKDMHLMTLCKHHIIANSSFSWWGAWLSGNKEQRVIAPHPWFDDKTIHTGDLIPQRWISLDK